MSESIGRYRILDPIGRGGMGTVFKAHDPTLDRFVAIKVVSTDTQITAELRTRFYREAQACARLSHPNIVTVHELGETPDRLFIVMELLEGEELRRIIAERRALALEEKLALIVQICDGLHYAHQKGVIHRDIKPGNIFVLPDGQVKILDFGIARIVQSDSDPTRTGNIMGTLRYMAPEQARGRTDHRSDMFSAGAVFYELLSYRHAFDSDDPLELLELLRSEDPSPLATVCPEVPAEVSATVARAMRKQPGERFADFAAMRDELETVRQHLAHEAGRLQLRVRSQLDEARALAASLAEQVGAAPEDLGPSLEDLTGLTVLQRLEHRLPEHIARLRDRMTRASRLDPVLGRAEAALAAGALPEALHDLEALLEDLPDHRRARAALGRLQAVVEAAPPGDPTSRLRERVAAALARADARSAAEAACAEGKARDAVDDLHGAAERFAAALERDPTHPWASSALAGVRARLDAREAREAEIARRLAAVEEALEGSDPPATEDRLSRLVEIAPDLPQLLVLRFRARQQRERASRPGAEPMSLLAPRARRWRRWPAIVTAAVLVSAGGGGYAAHRLGLPVWPFRSAEQLAAQRERDTMMTSREAAAREDPEKLFPALWVHALERELGAELSLVRGEYPVARERFAGARDGYRRIAAEARAVALQAQTEENARRLAASAVGARRAAEQVAAERRASAAWTAAVAKQREAETVAGLGDFGRAQTLWRDVAQAYRQAETEATRRETEERERLQRLAAIEVEKGQAEGARRQMGEARAQAAQAEASRLAATALAAAEAKSREAQAAFGRQEFVRARDLFAEARGNYERVTLEARRLVVVEKDRIGAEQLRVQTAQARQLADRAQARRWTGPLLDTTEAKERDGVAAVGRQDYARAQQLFREAQADYERAARESVRLAAVERDRTGAEQARAQVAQTRAAADGAQARRWVGPLLDATEAKDREAQAAFGRQEYARAQQLFRDAQADYERVAQEAARVAGLEGGRARADEARSQTREARNRAEQAGARRLAGSLLAAADARDRDAQVALDRQEFPRAQQLFREAQGEYQKGADEARRLVALEREREGAEQARARVVEARGQAERAEVKRWAVSLLSGAEGRERDAMAALGRQEYPRAQQLFREAQAEYQRATDEGKRLAALAESQRVAAEQARAQLAQVQEQVGRVEARRWAAPLVAAAELKDREAQAAFGRQDYARAQQLFRDAQAEYQKAAEEARQVAVVTEGQRTRADLARSQVTLAREQAERVEAGRWVAPLLAAAGGKDRDAQGAFGRQEYPRAEQLFREAQADYQKAANEARRLAALAESQGRGAESVQVAAAPAPTVTAPPSLPDAQNEIRRVIEDYRRAFESRDIRLLQRIRAGIGTTELGRISASFREGGVHRVQLSVEAIDVRTNDAEARGRRQDEFTSPQGRAFRSESPFVFKLRRTETGWVIADVK